MVFRGGVKAELAEPVGDLTSWLRAYRLPVLLGELSALGDGGDVGAVGVHDGFEDVAGFGEVVGFGDDADVVVLLPAGHCHVQAATGGGRGGEGDAAGLVVGLVVGFGGRVAEADVLLDVAGREGDGAVSVELGDGHVAGVADQGHDPQLAVADDVTGGGVQLALVAAGCDDVTDSRLTVGDHCCPGGVEVAVLDSALLDEVVDGVDVIVGGGGDRHRLTGCVAFDPVSAIASRCSSMEPGMIR